MGTKRPVCNNKVSTSSGCLLHVSGVCLYLFNISLAGKPKLAPKKDSGPKLKISKKEQSQVPPSKKKTGVQAKLPPSGKRPAILDDKNLVKLPWSVSTYN